MSGDLGLSEQNERLWSENRRLRRVLELIASHNPRGCRGTDRAEYWCFGELQKMARAALEVKP